MSLDQFVNFQIQVNSSGVVRAGFGLIGVVTYKSHFGGRTKLYSKTADMLTDGYLATDVEVLAVGRILSQQPRPANVLLLRCSLVPTMITHVQAAVATAKAEYDLVVAGEGFATTTATYVAGATPTLSDIHSSLLTQLNAVSSKNYTATFTPLVYADITVTADATTNLLDKAAHGLNHGAGPFTFANAGGALPAGIVGATQYWVIHTDAMDADHFQIADSLAHALAGIFIDITTNGTGTQTMSDVVGVTVDPSLPIVVTGNTAGAWFSLESLDVDLLGITQVTADPGIATDLDTIIKRDNSWYYLDTLFNSKACVLAAAAWIEANGKAYMPTNNDSASCTTDAPGTDTAGTLLGLSYKATMYQYHSSQAAMLSEGLNGLLAPKNVGLWTAKGKTPVGVPPVALTPDHTAKLLARKCNSFTLEGGKNVTWEGAVANSSYGFLDVKVSLDFVSDAVIKAAYAAMTALDKVAYTDEDIAVIQGAIEGVILDCMSPAHKIMAPGTPDNPNDPAPSITFPKVADIDPSVRALRELPDGQLTFRLQGAVHKVFVTATVSF